MTKAVELGATLYIPVQHPRLAEVLAGSNPDLRSVVICLEDSLHETEVGAAQDVFCATLRALDTAPPALIAYTRPRNPAMLTWMQAQPGIERLAGFVLPKVTTTNLPDWLARLESPAHGIMPTIESAEAFDRAALTAMAIIQMITGVIVWFRPDERLSVEEVSQTYLAMTRRLVGAPGLSSGEREFPI